MILCNLQLKNFKRYKEKTIEFSEGLIGIIGKDGTGRSTIFEAILFVLYGEPTQRGWKEAIRNYYATSEDVVSIELTFEFEGIRYRVQREFTRTAQGANAHLFKNEELQVSGTEEVTASIIALIKMTKDTFIHTFFVSQNELSILSTLNNEDRNKMIRKLLGLGKIDYIETQLITQIDELKKEISLLAQHTLSSEEIQEKQNSIDESQSLKEIYDKDIVNKVKEIESIILQEVDINRREN